MASPTQWTWVWVNPGSWWWTGKPGVLQSVGSQRVRHNWATELNWTEFEYIVWPQNSKGHTTMLRNFVYLMTFQNDYFIIMEWLPTPVFLPGESQDRGAWWATIHGNAESSMTELLALSLSCSILHPFSSKSFSFDNFALSVQFSSVAQSCLTLCDPMNRSTPGLPVHHQLPEFTQTHIHWVSDAIQPSHPLSSPSSPAPNPSQHQSLFQWVMRWPKYWSFSFSIIPSKEIPGLIYSQP